MHSRDEWVIGLSGGSEDRGALELAKWLSDAGARADWSVRGVHISSDGSLVQRLRRLVAPSRLSSRARVAGVIADARAAQSLAGVDVIEAETVENGLLESLGPTTLGLVIGRHAATDDPSLVKLGSTARRLLRRCHAPLFVVPPDFDPALVSVGPFLVATDLTERSKEAAAFARWLGEHLGRSVALAYVGAPRPSMELGLLTRSDIERLTAEERRRASLDLEGWADRLGMGDRQRVARVGPTTSELLHAAAALHAVAIVCSPRRLGLRQRFVQRSTTSDLAAAARIPVVSVPVSNRDRPWAPPARASTWESEGAGARLRGS